MMVGQISIPIFCLYQQPLLLSNITATEYGYKHARFKKTYFANTSLMESVIRLSPQIPVGNLRWQPNVQWQYRYNSTWFFFILKYVTSFCYVLCLKSETLFTYILPNNTIWVSRIIWKQYCSSKRGVHIAMEIRCSLDYAQPYFLSLAQIQDGGVGCRRPEWYALCPYSHNHLFPRGPYRGLFQGCILWRLLCQGCVLWTERRKWRH